MWRTVRLTGRGYRLQRAAGLKTVEGSIPQVTQRQIQAVLDSNKYKYSVGHASYVLQCPFCGEQRKGSGRTMFLNKTTGGVVCKPCDVKGAVSFTGEARVSLSLLFALDRDVAGFLELGGSGQRSPLWKT